MPLALRYLTCVSTVNGKDVKSLNTERYALNSVICQGEAVFGHLSGGGSFGSFSKLGQFDLVLHTALSYSNSSFNKVKPGAYAIMGNLLGFTQSYSLRAKGVF